MRWTMKKKNVLTLWQIWDDESRFFFRRRHLNEYEFDSMGIFCKEGICVWLLFCLLFIVFLNQIKKKIHLRVDSHFVIQLITIYVSIYSLSINKNSETDWKGSSEFIFKKISWIPIIKCESHKNIEPFQFQLTQCKYLLHFLNTKDYQINLYSYNLWLRW